MTVSYSAPLSAGLRALLDSVPESTPVTTREVTYVDGAATLAGFVARPAEPTGAAVLIIHDWTGLNDHSRVRAQLLARLGYIALAGDVYGDGLLVGQDAAPAQAGRFYRDTDLFRARMQANLDHLRSLPGVDPDRIVVLGYCFGGSGTLELARSGATAAGFVSFHGNLATTAPAGPGAVRAPLLVLTGAADPIVPDDQVIAFENELRHAGAPDWQVVSYSGAMHAFTHPDAHAPDHGAAFQPTADRRSWATLRAFLDEVAPAG